MQHLTTVVDAAKHMKVCPDFLYRRVKSGELPHYKVGSDYRVDLTEIRQHFRIEKREASR